jgi:O-antigen/teichoic acid export membrane protein
MPQLIKMTSVMCLMGIVIGIALFLFSRVLIVDILGQNYIAAISLLQIFSLVVVLFFTNAPLATVVQSSDLVRKFLPWGILNTILNLVLNFYFIPIYGVIAAAWIMLISETTGLLINLYFVSKVYEA